MTMTVPLWEVRSEGAPGGGLSGTTDTGWPSHLGSNGWECGRSDTQYGFNQCNLPGCGS